MYYLQSRYYDPETGRFINADDVALLGADGTPLSYNLFAYCKNNPVNGADPTGMWDWELVAKIAITTVVVAACLTGVGAIAAAAAAATAVSVTTAVTVAVATAGVSTALSAADGAICAQQNGGDWRDGAMAGAIGGSVGALVSSITNPASGTDGALRMNTLGRAASSATYDMTYALFDSGKITSSDLATCAVDVTMDISLAPINYYYSGSIGNSLLRASVNGIVDGAVDVFQTRTYFKTQ